MIMCLKTSKNVVYDTKKSDRFDCKQVNSVKTVVEN